jgi:hypothetical protein
MIARMMMSEEDFKAFLKDNGYEEGKSDGIFERFTDAHWDTVYFWQDGLIFLNRSVREGDRWVGVRDFVIRELDKKSKEYVEMLMTDNFMIGDGE